MQYKKKVLDCCSLTRYTHDSDYELNRVQYIFLLNL